MSLTLNMMDSRGLLGKRKWNLILTLSWGWWMLSLLVQFLGQVFHICVEKNVGVSITEVFVPDQTWEKHSLFGLLLRSSTNIWDFVIFFFKFKNKSSKLQRNSVCYFCVINISIRTSCSSSMWYGRKILQWLLALAAVTPLHWTLYKLMFIQFMVLFSSPRILYLGPLNGVMPFPNRKTTRWYTSNLETEIWALEFAQHLWVEVSRFFMVKGECLSPSVMMELWNLRGNTQFWLSSK